MKTLTSTLTALTFFLCLAFTSCKKDNSAAPPPTTITGSIEPGLTNGTWRVGFFADNGTDKTNNYSGFKMTFNKNGIVTAINEENITFTGSWWSTNDNGKLKLNLDFVNDGGFENLTHDWTILQQSSTQIQMTNVNGDAADFLTLNKNLIK